MQKLTMKIDQAKMLQKKKIINSRNEKENIVTYPIEFKR